MKRSVYSPISASMRCSSRAVPSVATTIACVSPRVKSAEPCVRGSTPVRMRDRPHGARVAAVDARLARQDLVAHDLRFELEHEVVDLVGVAGRRVRRDALGGDLRVDVLQPLLARLLGAQLIRFAQRGVGDRGDLGDHRLVLRRRLPVPQRLAARFDELVDQRRSPPAAAGGRTPRRPASLPRAIRWLRIPPSAPRLPCRRRRGSAPTS